MHLLIGAYGMRREMLISLRDRDIHKLRRLGSGFNWIKEQIESDATGDCHARILNCPHMMGPKNYAEHVESG